MTTVYGVTFVGAREQIERQLRLADIVDPDMRYQVAAFLANVVSVTLGLTMEGCPLCLHLDTSLHRQSLPRRQRYPKLAINLRQAHLPVYSGKPCFLACRRGDGKEKAHRRRAFRYCKGQCQRAYDCCDLDYSSGPPSCSAVSQATEETARHTNSNRFH